MTPCRICANDQGNTPYRVREMLLGTRHEFDYFQCGQCGCLQIVQPPDTLADYYPSGYFSFRDYRKLAGNPLRGWLDRQRVGAALGHGGSLVGTLANLFAKPLDYVAWLEKTGKGTACRVLDVGCGSGKLLLRMRLGGVDNCMGIDPFLAEDIRYPNGLVIHRQDIRDTQGQFDLLMFHHAFEHMDRPAEVMAEAVRLLAPGGVILIRVPLADSEAWEHYREHWWSLDAPRHLFLHTRKSMEILARAAGLEIFDSFRDSTPSQFINSELYARDIPLSAGTRPETVLTQGQLAGFRARTAELNLAGRGDMGGFFLRRPNAPA